MLRAGYHGDVADPIVRDEGLSLRLAEREAPHEPPDLSAFAGTVDAGLLDEQVAGHDDRTGPSYLVDAALLASRLRVVITIDPLLRGSPVFMTTRTCPIPAIEPSSPAVEPRAFALSSRIHGHLGWVPARGPAAPRSASVVLAVCIPLTVPDFAAAQPPARPIAPQERAVAEPAATPQPAPKDSVPSAPASVVVAPEGPALPPMAAILAAMNGRNAVVFVRGASITGQIISVEGEFVMMIDHHHAGKIALIPKSEVIEVRGKLPASQEDDMPTGLGRIIPGSIMVGVGAPLMLSGLIFLGFSPSSYFLYLPQILPAGALLGVGIPMLITGQRQRRAYKAASAARLARVRFAPQVAPTRGGWTGGLTLRF